MALDGQSGGIWGAKQSGGTTTDLVVDTTIVSNGTSNTIFYEKADGKFGQAEGFTYDDVSKTLQFVDDLVAPKIGMTIGKFQPAPGVFMSGFGLFELGDTDFFGVGYFDLSAFGGQKKVIVGKSLDNNISVTKTGVEILTVKDLDITSGGKVNLSAGENVDLSAEAYVNISSLLDINLNSTSNSNLKAEEFVNIQGKSSKLQLGNNVIGEDCFLFYNNEFGYKPILAGGLNAFQEPIFGVFGSLVTRQEISIDPSTLTQVTSFDTLLVEVATALINYGLLKL